MKSLPVEPELCWRCPIADCFTAAESIGTVLVAAGYRPYHPWLHLPVLAPDGSICQRRLVA